jgi:quercetin dioxygenase-like cupin family protein
MKACTLVPVVSLVLLWPASPLAQDPVQVDPTHYKTVLDNATVRVLRGFLAAGAKSPMHQHPDSIVIALQDVRARFTMPDGKTQDQRISAESAYYSPAGTHTTTNTASAGLNVLIVEFKGAKPGTAPLPASRTGLDMKVLAEGPRGMAYRTTADPSFHEEPGTTHEFDQLVVSLRPAQLTLAIQGKPARTTWTRGDVVFVPRGQQHESRNTGGKPADFIIVAIR